ncbi:MAG: 30S ribosomal protein S19e [Candidatus Thermoplasmatota archaeon]|nr:30S ribosomal protein S19e [Candidatus Thermoplasmatota archaeon]
MTTPYDVPAKDLIDELSKKLQKEKEIFLPEENRYARTSVTNENPPIEKDWWYTRCASILRKVYINNQIGVERLASEYGGKRDRGSKPYRAMGGSGTIARRALQQLEKAGLITKIKGKGRSITPKGRSFLDNTASEVMQKIETQYPGLKKY